jgi:hypothetical protein
MIGLLTAFFLYHADAGWGWWAIWALLEFGSLVKFIRNSQ